MMMKFWCVCFCALGLFINNVFAAPFVEGFEDLPIPQGMEQLPHDNLSFGNEETSLTEAYLSGDIEFSNVCDFYLTTLPQLGWSFVGKDNNTLSFERDNQRLEIAQEGKKPLVVRLTIKSWN